MHPSENCPAQDLAACQNLMSAFHPLRTFERNVSVAEKGRA